MHLVRLCHLNFKLKYTRPNILNFKLDLIYGTGRVRQVHRGRQNYFLELDVQNRLHNVRLNPLITEHPVHKAVTQISRLAHSAKLLISPLSATVANSGMIR